MPRKNYREWYANLSPAEKQKVLDRNRDWQKRNPERVKAYQTKAQNKTRKRGYSIGPKSERMDYVKQRKIAIGQCADCSMPCDEYTHVCFAFDHLDPTTKSFGLSRAHNHTYEQIDREIDKCELVCHNCHAIRTWYLEAHRNPPRQLANVPTLFD